MAVNSSSIKGFRVPIVAVLLILGHLCVQSAAADVDIARELRHSYTKVIASYSDISSLSRELAKIDRASQVQFATPAERAYWRGAKDKLNRSLAAASARIGRNAQKYLAVLDQTVTASTKDIDLAKELSKQLTDREGDGTYRLSLAQAASALNPSILEAARPSLEREAREELARVGEEDRLDESLALLYHDHAGLQPDLVARLEDILGYRDIETQEAILDSLLDGTGESTGLPGPLTAAVPRHSDAMVAEGAVLRWPEVGDLLYRPMGPSLLGPFRYLGHVGLYVGATGDLTRASNHFVLEMDGRTCSVNSLKEVYDAGMGPITFLSPSANDSQRRAALREARSMVGRRPWYSMGPGWRSPEVPMFRCDGLVYWAYDAGAGFKTILLDGQPVNFLNITPSAIHGFWSSRGRAYGVPEDLRWNL